MTTNEHQLDWWQPRNLTEAQAAAKTLAASSLVPNQYRNRPQDILVAWSLGAQLGLSLLASLRTVAVINGIPSLWGDGMLAVVLAHPECEGVDEEFDGEGDARKAICTVRRRGRKPVTREFSVADAKRAGLWGHPKKEPWRLYPQRMLQMRARSWALRDAFADALSGMACAEEIADMVPAEAEVVDENAESATEALKIRLRRRRGEQEQPEPEGAPDAGEEGEDVIESETPPDDTSARWRKAGKEFRYDERSETWLPE